MQQHNLLPLASAPQRVAALAVLQSRWGDLAAPRAT